jgi:hypothetical protein
VEDARILQHRSVRGALDSACAHGESADEAWPMWLLGEIASRIERPDVAQAETRYREALAVARERRLGWLSGSKPLPAAA